jgi:aldehyde dehydrogenase (NAD+)
MDNLGKIEDLRRKQDLFFSSRKTRDINFRKNSLRRLRDSIIKHDKNIREALHKDLNKSSFETYASETGLVLDEIRIHLRNLSKWANPKRVSTPLIAVPSKSQIVLEPFGKVLIISPWNYPFQLPMVPLVGALAAGNVVIIRHSRYSPGTNAIIREILNESFSEDYVASIDCDIETAEKALKLKWDLIFFTGSTEVGRKVYQDAAENLTPVVLELGGKSPVIVDEDAKISVAARRIVWGKLFNAGQSCVAPDYLFANEKIKDRLILALKEEIVRMYGNEPTENPDYPRIISEKAFGRITDLINNSKILFGGKYNKDRQSVEPTLIESSLNDPVMQDEIFGPLLPIIGFNDLDEIILYLKTKEKPLALYYFSNDRKKQKKIIHETTSGACLINDVVVHFANKNLPLGGVGKSGIGRYHGYESFRTFSNIKAVMKTSTRIDIPLKYPPFRNKERLLRLFLR